MFVRCRAKLIIYSSKQVFFHFTHTEQQKRPVLAFYYCFERRKSGREKGIELHFCILNNVWMWQKVASTELNFDWLECLCLFVFSADKSNFSLCALLLPRFMTIINKILLPFLAFVSSALAFFQAYPHDTPTRIRFKNRSIYASLATVIRHQRITSTVRPITAVLTVNLATEEEEEEVIKSINSLWKRYSTFGSSIPIDSIKTRSECKQPGNRFWILFFLLFPFSDRGHFQSQPYPTPLHPTQPHHHQMMGPLADAELNFANAHRSNDGKNIIDFDSSTFLWCDKTNFPKHTKHR